jgi:hypothetical protein
MWAKGSYNLNKKQTRAAADKRKKRRLFVCFLFVYLLAARAVTLALGKYNRLPAFPINERFAEPNWKSAGKQLSLFQI